MNIYYIYAYLRQDGTPYYIGKGKDNRAWKKHSVRLPTNPNNIVIMESNLTEIGAWALERRYIEWYGRKDIGTGILRNMTDGGDGPAGKIPWNKGKKLPPLTEEWKAKLSQSAKKRPPITDEIKKKMSEQRKGVPKSAEHRSKLAMVVKIKCPHCGKIAQKLNIFRYHLDKCKLYPLNAVK
jgi:hypothetical protein